MSDAGVPGCPLCETDGGALVWRGPQFRLVRVDQHGIGAFYRLIWNRHVREWTDLTRSERGLGLDAVAAVERTVREVLAPDKVNLASLGNQVPHLHWHIVARWSWDSHWPDPVWAQARRPGDASRLTGVLARLPEVDARACRALAQQCPPVCLTAPA